ncbi:hypothetical protein AJ80_03554 [Polytolypa hystricis UAMH7299]|uniref:Cytochrome P450 monooxygenase n=1 Tax=Polytolypa hystricis (strain UAMH7299) TaxID=1447883 RepID=A0A2B7YH61_POLH7|nr:hypothetical protein AJ80_03554 [Polytolypa hystricis UAMH7299]
MASLESKTAELGEGMIMSHFPSITYLVAVFMLYLIYALQRPKAKDSILLNPTKWFEISESRIKNDFVANARKLVRDGYAAVGKNKPFRILTNNGELTMLPHKYVDEVRNDTRFDFKHMISKEFHGHLPGFEGFQQSTCNSDLVKGVVIKYLTTYLNKVTKPLADEAVESFRDILTDSKEWHSIGLRSEIVRIVARLSSKVFLGDELCHDERWLQITVDYAVTVFRAADALSMYPYYLRPIVHWFVPLCREARKNVKEARGLIKEVLEKRQAQKAALEAQGKKVKNSNDAIDWFEDSAKGMHYDPAIAQLQISMAAIHTTSDLATQVILDLARNPDIIEPLRQEIVKCLTEGGWKKTSLYNLKLMDSVIKESQRVKPIASVALVRLVMEDVKFSDGTILPKGTKAGFSMDRMWDPSVHPDPERWDGYRFLNMRTDTDKNPSQANTAQLVSTCANHMAFGHGMHSCPGRFFAANEIKVFLCHFLLKYDFRLVEGAAEPRVWETGFSMNADPLANIEVRRRKEEMDLDGLEAQV